jgi:hypothetical protein
VEQFQCRHTKRHRGGIEIALAPLEKLLCPALYPDWRLCQEEQSRLTRLTQPAFLAFPSTGSGQAAERYFIILMFAIFALGERKNGKHIIVKYHAAAGRIQM